MHGNRLSSTQVSRKDPPRGPLSSLATFGPCPPPPPAPPGPPPACLKSGAVLVTNDRHFDAVGRAGIIPVMRVADAIRAWAASPEGRGHDREPPHPPYAFHAAGP